MNAGSTAPQRLAEITAGVWVATSRRFATTSTVVLDGHGGALVVDPAWDPDELAAIPADLASLGVRCAVGLATHVHYDHVLWHPDLGEVPRYASPTTVRTVTDQRDAVLAPLVGDLPPELVAVAGRLVPLPAGPGPALLPWAGPEALLHPHDAHAPGHLAVELTDRGVLLAGDMLSDLELPMPADEDDDLETYRTGLEQLVPVVRRARLLVPGHGSPTDDPLARLDADRRYLDAVVSGRPVDDPRLGLPGMAELHAANVRRAARTGQEAAEGR
ncbi:MAG: MBL fold metallo-hydrolase [Candidatus Nanopelagicales bacterium]